MKVPLEAERLESVIEEGVRRAGFAEAVIYLQITRGRATRHRGLPQDAEPTIVMTVRELPARAARLHVDGIAVITVPEFRWARCDIKSIALLPSVLAYAAAKRDGAGDAVFVEDDGTVNESTAGNVFIVTRGRLRTPPKSARILAGVTRDKILEAARAAGVETSEERITKAELSAADEMFLTSTIAEVMPVVVVDGKPIGNGKPGPVAARIYEQFAHMFIHDRVP